MSVPNYYQLFDIPVDADDDTIRAAIKTARKRWRQLTGSPDKDKARLAEQRMEQLEQVETTLLEPDARADYDAQLASAPAASEPATTAAGLDWGQRAKQYYHDGDVRNAFSAAKKGTDVDSENTIAWLYYVWSASDLKRHDDADFASAELIQRHPDVANFHELRGGVLDAMGRHKEAEASFRRAMALEPSNAYYASRAAWAVLDQGRIDPALTEAWQIVDRFPAEEFPVRVILAASESLRERKRPKEAFDVAQRLLSMRPQNAEALSQVVQAIQELEKSVSVDFALTEAWRLLDAYPSDPKALRLVQYVVSALRSRGREDDALRASRDLLARFPHDQGAKTSFAWSRIREAERRMTQTKPGAHVIINKTQAAYYDTAVRDVLAQDVTDPGVRRALDDMREYHSAQTRRRMKLSFGKILLGIIALIFFFIGLGTIASGGFTWLVFAALLGWAFYASAFKKQYQLNYKEIGQKLRTRGLRA